MATLTPTLTLASTNALSDTLNLSVTDTLTTTNPSEFSRISVSHSGNGTILYADSGAVAYVYIKNIGTKSRTIDIRTANASGAGTAYAQLAPGEFAFFPTKNNEGVEVISETSAETVEYGVFKKG